VAIGDYLDTFQDYADTAVDAYKSYTTADQPSESTKEPEPVTVGKSGPDSEPASGPGSGGASAGMFSGMPGWVLPVVGVAALGVIVYAVTD